MHPAQHYVEELLTESGHLTIFYGTEIDLQLSKILELLRDEAPAAQEFIRGWRAEIVATEVYRRSAYQNAMLELWGMVQVREPLPETLPDLSDLPDPIVNV